MWQGVEGGVTLKADYCLRTGAVCVGTTQIFRLQSKENAVVDKRVVLEKDVFRTRRTSEVGISRKECF